MSTITMQTMTTAEKLEFLHSFGRRKWYSIANTLRVSRQMIDAVKRGNKRFRPEVEAMLDKLVLEDNALLEVSVVDATGTALRKIVGNHQRQPTRQPNEQPTTFICHSCETKDKEISDLKIERDYLRKQVESLISALAAKPSSGAAPACGAHGGDLKERRRA